MSKISNLRKLILILVLLPVGIPSYAQLFGTKPLSEAEPFSNTQIAWADFDKNDSLDILVSGKISSTGEAAAYIIKNPWLTAPQYHQADINPLLNGDIALSDLNNDGMTDIFISGLDENNEPLSLIYFAKDHLQFEEKSYAIDGLYNGNNIIADFNNNGRKDLLVNGLDEDHVPQVYIYRNAGAGFVKVETAMIGLSQGTALVLDFNKDGLADLFFTGVDGAGTKRSILYQNDGDFKFSVAHEFDGLSLGKGAIGDFNSDGFTDILISGENAGNQYQTSVLLGSGEGFSVAELTLEGLVNNRSYLVDINHDGFTDILIAGENLQNKYVAIAYLGNGLGIDSQEIISEGKQGWLAMGDADRDGNPDIIEVKIDDNDDIQVNYYHNSTEEPNLGPSPAAHPIVLPMRNKTYFSWSPAFDDVTSSKALTYDVFIAKEVVDTLKYPDADMGTGYRRTVAHGSQFQDTTWVIYGLKEGEYDWGVMAVDNAFRGDGPSGICQGGSFRLCFEITAADTTICQKGVVKFKPVNNEARHVFSSNAGYMGIHLDFEYDVQEKDTLYFISTNPMVCTSSLELFINVPDDEEEFSLGEDLLVCLGEEINISIPSALEDIRWLVNGEEAGTGSDFSKNVNERLEVIVLAKTSLGCSITDTLIVDIAPSPDINISNDVSIAYGASANLFASGGSTYSWSPATGLSNPNIPNPIASPESTTVYTVVVTNEAGCVAEGTVTVSVRSNLFIPNLFTPNGDGNNETFRIYGNNIAHVVLQVFDRSGNLVYEGKGQEAFTRGWDGSKNGKDQPAGAYVWRLQGAYNDGSTITYQGKTTGTINLVR